MNDIQQTNLLNRKRIYSNLNSINYSTNFPNKQNYIKCKNLSCSELFASYPASFIHYRNTHSLISSKGKEEHLDFLTNEQKLKVRLNVESEKEINKDFFKELLQITDQVREMKPLNIYNGFVFDNIALKYTLEDFVPDDFDDTIEELLFLFFVELINLIDIEEVTQKVLYVIYCFIEFLNVCAVENETIKNFKEFKKNTKKMISLNLVTEIFVEDSILDFINFYCPLLTTNKKQVCSVLLLFSNWLRRSGKSNMRFNLRRR